MLRPGRRKPSMAVQADGAFRCHARSSIPRPLVHSEVMLAETGATISTDKVEAPAEGIFDLPAAVSSATITAFRVI